MTEARRRQAIVNMAIDPAFAARVRTEPEAVAREYGLDADDMAVLESLRDDTEAARTTVLDPRLSKSSLFFGGGGGAHQVHAHGEAGLFVCNFHPGEATDHGPAVEFGAHGSSGPATVADGPNQGIPANQSHPDGTATEYSWEGGRTTAEGDPVHGIITGGFRGDEDGPAVTTGAGSSHGILGPAHTDTDVDGEKPPEIVIKPDDGGGFSPHASDSDVLDGGKAPSTDSNDLGPGDDGLKSGEEASITSDQIVDPDGVDMTFNPDGSSVTHLDGGGIAVTQDTADGGTHTLFVGADGKAYGENTSNADGTDQIVGQMHGDGSESYFFASDDVGMVDGGGNAITDDQTVDTDGVDIAFNPDQSSVTQLDGGGVALMQDTADGGTHSVFVSGDGKVFGENTSNADGTDQIVGQMHGDGSESYFYASNDVGMVDGGGNAIIDEQTVDADGVDMTFNADGSSDTVDHATGAVTHEAGDGPLVDQTDGPTDADIGGKSVAVDNAGIAADLDAGDGQGPVDDTGSTDDSSGSDDKYDDAPAGDGGTGDGGTGDDDGGSDDGSSDDGSSDDGGKGGDAPTGDGGAGMSDPGGDGGDDGNSGGHRPVGTGTGGVDGGEPGSSLEGSPGKVAAVHTGSGVGNHQGPSSGGGGGEGDMDSNSGHNRFDLGNTNTVEVTPDDGTMVGTASHGAVDPTSGLHGAGH